MTHADATSQQLPPLKIRAPGEAVVALTEASETVLSALMIDALKAHAASIAGEDAAHTVSLSLDMTGERFSGDEAVFRSAVDRQTRSLLFMACTLLCGGRVLMKATGIFKLGQDATR
ncbi:hypothetical protein [Henriciella aquimarina]|uniref:hypothetical protein n=1 Tax=Henriciella aquimarina TaxID=545261 RepID=UPI000A064232|nr:hypothetical protein [Henriciella aquimarina]